MIDNTATSPAGSLPTTRPARTSRSLRYRLVRGAVVAVVAAAAALGLATGVYELTQDSPNTTAVSVASAHADVALDMPAERPGLR